MESDYDKSVANSPENIKEHSPQPQQQIEQVERKANGEEEKQENDQADVETQRKSPSKEKSTKKSKSPRRSKTRSKERPKRDFRQRKQYSPSPQSKNQGTTLFVANFRFSVREPDLEKLFEQYGKINECRIKTDPSTRYGDLTIDQLKRESRGFAFVEFEKSEDAKNAIQALDGSDFQGKDLKVEYSKRKTGYNATPGVYLGTTRRRRRSPFRRRRGYYHRRSRSGSRGYRHKEGGNRYHRQPNRYGRDRSRSREYDRGNYGRYRKYSPRRSNSRDRYRRR